jgi:HD-like signal output (HDOD) protein
MAEVIETDTDLTARLLRIVNSAMYRLAAPIETISRAITLIGMLDLRDLAMLTVARRLFTGIPADLMDLRLFWRDALGTGVHASLLGRMNNMLHAERVFVMGVLHNIGLLALCQVTPEQEREALFIADGDPETLADAERELLGYSHQEVGAALIARWRLPVSIGEVAAYHHQPTRAVAFPLEVAIVHAAGLISAGDALGWGRDDLLRRVHPAAAALTGLNASRLAEVQERGRRQIEELAAQFAD